MDRESEGAEWLSISTGVQENSSARQQQHQGSERTSRCNSARPSSRDFMGFPGSFRTWELTFRRRWPSRSRFVSARRFPSATKAALPHRTLGALSAKAAQERWNAGRCLCRLHSEKTRQREDRLLPFAHCTLHTSHGANIDSLLWSR
jgi:hypothetical protein